MRTGDNFNGHMMSLASTPSELDVRDAFNQNAERLLKLSKEKMENIKSPVFLKLANMIETLDNYRNNMEG